MIGVVVHVAVGIVVHVAVGIVASFQHDHLMPVVVLLHLVVAMLSFVVLLVFLDPIVLVVLVVFLDKFGVRNLTPYVVVALVALLPFVVFPVPLVVVALVALLSFVVFPVLLVYFGLATTLAHLHWSPVEGGEEMVGLIFRVRVVVLFVATLV